MDIAEELKRRESRLAEIGRAKAEIERRAAERDAVERAEYEEKSGREREKEGAGRAKDQVNLTDVSDHAASGFEHRGRGQPPGGRRACQPEPERQA